MSLYSWYVIWQIMILIGGKSWVFLHSYDIFFTWMPCAINITFSNMVNGISTFFKLLIFFMSFTLQSWISPWFLYSKTCIYLPQSCRSSLSNATACSYSSIACWCSSCIVSTHFLFWIEQQFQLHRQGRWKYHVNFVPFPAYLNCNH